MSGTRVTAALRGAQRPSSRASIGSLEAGRAPAYQVPLRRDVGLNYNYPGFGVDPETAAGALLLGGAPPVAPGGAQDAPAAGGGGGGGGGIGNVFPGGGGDGDGGAWMTPPPAQPAVAPGQPGGLALPTAKPPPLSETQRVQMQQRDARIASQVAGTIAGMLGSLIPGVGMIAGPIARAVVGTVVGNAVGQDRPGGAKPAEAPPGSAAGLGGGEGDGSAAPAGGDPSGAPSGAPAGGGAAAAAAGGGGYGSPAGGAGASGGASGGAGGGRGSSGGAAAGGTGGGAATQGVAAAAAAGGFTAAEAAEIGAVIGMSPAEVMSMDPADVEAAVNDALGPPSSVPGLGTLGPPPTEPQVIDVVPSTPMSMMGVPTTSFVSVAARGMPPSIAAPPATLAMEPPAPPAPPAPVAEEAPASVDPASATNTMSTPAESYGEGGGGMGGSHGGVSTGSSNDVGIGADEGGVSAGTSGSGFGDGTGDGGGGNSGPDSAGDSHGGTSSSSSGDDGWRHGGLIPGNGDGVSEPRQITAHENEFIMRPEAVQALGPEILSMLNSMGGGPATLANTGGMGMPEVSAPPDPGMAPGMGEEGPEYWEEEHGMAEEQRAERPYGDVASSADPFSPDQEGGLPGGAVTPQTAQDRLGSLPLEMQQATLATLAADPMVASALLHILGPSFAPMLRRGMGARPMMGGPMMGGGAPMPGMGGGLGGVVPGGAMPPGNTGPI